MLRPSSTLSEVCVLALALVLLCVPARAQDQYLLDVFGSKVSSEDLMARLDGLLQRMKNQPGSVAVIRGQRENGETLGFTVRNFARMKTYLTNRKVEQDRVQLQQCSESTEPYYRVYLLPPGRTLPPCVDVTTVPTATTLFDSYGFSFIPWQVEDCCSIPGSDVAGAAASLKAFGDLLSRAPDSRAVDIAYNGTNLWFFNNRARRPMDSALVATRMALDGKRSLVRQGVAAERIKAINGGYRESTRSIELWFVPSGGVMPKPTPNYFPKAAKSKTKR